MPATGTKNLVNPRVASANVTELKKPVNLPPELSVQDGQEEVTAEAQPVSLTDAQLAAMVNSAATASTAAPTAPTMEPPGVKEAVLGTTATTWINNVLVNALWNINQNRNVFASFAGKGFQKFSDNSDSAIMAFTTLAAHARVAQGSTSYRLEADNKIHEFYVF